MDARNGLVMPEVELLKYLGESDFHRYATPVMVDKLTPIKREQLRTTGRTKVGRNDPCPCGSEKKFKRCCYGKEPACIIA